MASEVDSQPLFPPLLQRVALDCLSYHATATDNDTTWLARESIPLAGDFNLYSYKFNDTLYQDSKTLKIVLRMFLDFDLINKFSIPYKVNYIFKVAQLLHSSAANRLIGEGPYLGLLLVESGYYRFHI